MKFDITELDKNLLINLYKGILRPRMIEEKMLILLRQGKISKWFSGIGQEAISVGVTMALDFDEYILPMHRNLGVFTSKDIPLNRLFSQFQGKLNGFTKGRDRSFHFGSKDHNIVGMISHLGPQMGVADGIALANKIKKNKRLLQFLQVMVVQAKEIFMKLSMLQLYGSYQLFLLLKIMDMVFQLLTMNNSNVRSFLIKE